jgi:carbohydrate diacid regulator
MNNNQELDKALKELERITGLSLSVKITDENNLSETVSQLRALSNAYKEKNNKNLVIRKWMLGEISEVEFFDLAKKLHIPFEEKRVLYLITMQEHKREEITTILRNMFPHNSNIWIISMTATSLVLLQSFHRKEPKPRKTAYEILDTISSEALTQVKISYSEITSHLEELPRAYHQASFSMKVGETFYCDHFVYGHDHLGIGRLLYDVSPELCEDYIYENLKETLLTESSPVFQADMLHTVNCFLDNNLNIAETARQLHIHRNTLLYRLEQIEKETGLDIRQFNQAMTYKISSMVLLKLTLLHSN